MKQEPDNRLIDEILADEAWLSPHMQISMPARTMANAQAKIKAALAQKRRQRIGRLIGWSLSGVAAAAACIIAAITLNTAGPAAPEGIQQLNLLSHERAVEAFVGDPVIVETDFKLAVLNMHMTALARDLAERPGSALDLQMDAMSRDLELFWMDSYIDSDMDEVFNL